MGKNRPRDLVMERRLSEDWRHRVTLEQAAAEAWRLGVVVHDVALATAQERSALEELMAKTRFKVVAAETLQPLSAFIAALDRREPSPGDASRAHELGRSAFDRLVRAETSEVADIFDVAADLAEEAADYRSRRNAIDLAQSVRRFQPAPLHLELGPLLHADPGWNGQTASSKNIVPHDRWRLLEVREMCALLGALRHASRLPQVLRYRWRLTVDE